MLVTYGSTAEVLEDVYTFEEWEREYIKIKKQKKAQIMERIGQKCLGLGLAAIGILGCFVFPEDAGGFVFTSILGIIRIVY